MAGLRLKAYAKLNLTLRVVGLEPTGYHRLCSLAVAVDWADLLRLEPRSRGIAVRVVPDLGIPLEENLVLRAARLLEGRFPGVEITLYKSIPPGAGLGGGSSDAAATLVGLDRLFSLGLSQGELAELARGLGADVPFFLGESPAWMEGTGDLLRPAKVEVPEYFLILVPPFPCSTAAVYREFDKLGLPFSEPVHILDYRNDLWDAACRVCPELPRYRELLEGLGAEGVGMTGSGSALFAAFPGEGDATRALREVRGRAVSRGLECLLRLVRPRRWGYDISPG